MPAAVQRRLTTAGIDAAGFAAFRQAHDRRTAERVREGDLDALIYYALQSTAFTSAAPIEPALSARALVDSLDAERRQPFLEGADVGPDQVPAAARQRLTALIGALSRAAPRSRLGYFRAILERAAPPDARAFVQQQYLRSMRFLYQKEFVAPRHGGADAVAALYRERGLSTDSAVEAGYVVQLGLATLRAVEPARRIRRVLIVGPGMDLAPRTGLIEAGPPESYQPYTIVDALVSLGLSRLDDLLVAGADVNPRVVEHLDGARNRAVVLTLVSGVADAGAVTLQDDYRRYFNAIGGAIGAAASPPVLLPRYDGHLRRTIAVRSEASALVRGVRLDVATERLDPDTFDLIVATNVLPYLDDTLLALALTNIAAMLEPGGVFLHNEARPLLGEIAPMVGLPLQHARTATLASVRGAPPLADGIWIHEKVRQAGR